GWHLTRFVQHSVGAGRGPPSRAGRTPSSGSSHRSVSASAGNRLSARSRKTVLTLQFFEGCRPCGHSASNVSWCHVGETIRGPKIGIFWPRHCSLSLCGEKIMLLKPLTRDLQPQVVLPLNAAAYCADCEAVFDGRNRQSCVACASSVIVPVSCLIDKSSLLAPPWSSRGRPPRRHEGVNAPVRP